MPRIVFFGTPAYSLIVLNRLYDAGFPILAVVTKQAQPVGRKQEFMATPVAAWADARSVPVFTPDVASGKPWQFANAAQLTQDIVNLKPDLLVVADYAQKIPAQLLAQIPAGGLNVHPSLLPKYRGPAPVPWALVNGETETGVSIVTLAEEFDSGTVIAQEKESILSTDTTHSLLTRLFEKGAKLLVDTIPAYGHTELASASPALNHGIPKPASTRLDSARLARGEQVRDDINHPMLSYTPRLTRNHGFIPWKLVQAAMRGESFSSLVMKQWNNVTIVKAFLDRKDTNYTSTPVAVLLDRAFRAFHSWPGIWSKITVNGEEKRVKLLQVHLEKPTILSLDEIQLEGKQPIRGKDVVNFLRQRTP